MSAHKWSEVSFAWGGYYLCDVCGERMDSEADLWKADRECVATS